MSGEITVSFTVDVRIAQSLMALYEMLTLPMAPKAVTIDDVEFGTEEEDWPGLWMFWVEAFYDRLPCYGFPPEWDEKQRQFCFDLFAADRRYFGQTVDVSLMRSDEEGG